jgi:hypothetical protein
VSLLGAIFLPFQAQTYSTTFVRLCISKILPIFYLLFIIPNLRHYKSAFIFHPIFQNQNMVILFACTLTPSFCLICLSFFVPSPWAMLSLPPFPISLLHTEVLESKVILSRLPGHLSTWPKQLHCRAKLLFNQDSCGHEQKSST